MRAPTIKDPSAHLLAAVLDPAWEPTGEELMALVMHVAAHNPRALLKLVVWLGAQPFEQCGKNAMRLAAVYAQYYPDVVSYNVVSIASMVGEHVMSALAHYNTDAARMALRGFVPLPAGALPAYDPTQPLKRTLKQVVDCPALKLLRTE